MFGTPRAPRNSTCSDRSFAVFASRPARGDRLLSVCGTGTAPATSLIAKPRRMHERLFDDPGVWVRQLRVRPGVSIGSFQEYLPVEAASSRLAVTEYDNLEVEHETTHWHIGELNSATAVCAGDPR